MPKYIPGVGWDNEPQSRFAEIANSGTAPRGRVSNRSRNPHEKIYYSQLADRPNDPKAIMSHDEARRECDKRGYTYTDMKTFAD